MLQVPNARLCAVMRNTKVTASAIFLAEPEAAQFLAQRLPLGKGFVCLDTKDLPRIFAGIFARAATGGGGPQAS